MIRTKYKDWNYHLRSTFAVSLAQVLFEFYHFLFFIRNYCPLSSCTTSALWCTVEPYTFFSRTFRDTRIFELCHLAINTYWVDFSWWCCLKHLFKEVRKHIDALMTTVENISRYGSFLYSVISNVKIKAVALNFFNKVRRKSGEAAALRSSVRASNPSFFALGIRPKDRKNSKTHKHWRRRCAQCLQRKRIWSEV